MDMKLRKEDIIRNGSEDELYELRIWLFKESCRLENQESTIDEKFEKLTREEKDFKREASAISERIDLQKAQLQQEKDLFEQKMRILKNGFDQLNEDKKRLNREWDKLEARKSIEEERMDDRREVLFLGVTNQVALKKRYKDLMKIYHPDNLNGDHRMVQMINEEYTNLSRHYDVV